MRLSHLFLGDDGLEKMRLEKLMLGGESKYLVTQLKINISKNDLT